MSAVPGLLFFQCALAGCAGIDERPEVNPDKWAPPKVTDEWVPTDTVVRQYTVENAQPGRPASAAMQPGTAYDLGSLIDIALRNNPQTRRQWQVARSAADQFGAAQAPYYPQVDMQSGQGYQRTILELPAAVGKLEQWQSQPAVELTYILLDFGRRQSAVEMARNDLIASNFAFNRGIQNVVFSAQSAFYSIDAAHAAVSAAQQNLELAQTDFDAVKQRVNLGLATAPELLLAKERLAQSQFDLANTHSLVHDAEAQLAVALGIPANAIPPTESLESQAVPNSLKTSVERLIARACRERPDLAARTANLRAREAAVSQAKAQFYPEVALSAGYGENLWNFSFDNPHTVQTGQPQYSALLSLKWDIFTGFKRLNDMRRAEADREVARADLESLKVDTIAQVWRVYYEFESSLSKYDYARNLLDAASESYNANLETYHQGLSTIIELLTAQRDLAQARYTLIQSKADLLTAYAAVAYAVGSISIP
ncbi:MAG: TolC family protein [Deltaproteobacteria bacterium]|nr:TolC family protein [Deltaproteobacteria bacterium]